MYISDDRKKFIKIDSSEPKIEEDAKVMPLLKWKYDYNDRDLNNTIGSPGDGSPMPTAVSLPTSGYGPSDIAGAYGFDKIPDIGDGRGKTIAIVVAFGNPYVQKDLNYFCAAYGIPTTKVYIYYPDSIVNPLAETVTVNGWNMETNLDVQWTHAMAPGAKIALVVARSNFTKDLLKSVEFATNFVKADIVNMSWGGSPQSYENLYDYVFENSHVSYVASSGDVGNRVSWPSSSPYVTSVGGTSLVYDPRSKTILQEVAWTDGGGGISKYVPRPGYQVGFNTSSFRSTPDLSLVADPYTGVAIYLTDATNKTAGWYVVGGTSVSAPIMSALLARRTSLGNAGTTRFNDKAYGVAGTAYSTYFRDITEGSTGESAHAGYDLATGLGCPIADQIVQIPA